MLGALADLHHHGDQARKLITDVVGSARLLIPSA